MSKSSNKLSNLSHDDLIEFSVLSNLSHDDSIESEIQLYENLGIRRRFYRSNSEDQISVDTFPTSMNDISPNYDEHNISLESNDNIIDSHDTNIQSKDDIDRNLSSIDFIYNSSSESNNNLESNILNLENVESTKLTSYNVESNMSAIGNKLIEINNIDYYSKCMEVELYINSFNAGKLDNIENIDMYFPIQIAINNNQSFMVQYCISRQCNVNILDNNNETPLMLTVKKGNVEIFDILMNDYSINVNVKNRNGLNALHYAAIYNQLNMLKRLIYKVENRYLDDNYGRNILQLACENERLDIINFIINDVNSDIRRYDFQYALHNSVINNKVEVLKLLIRKPDYIYSIDKDGNNILHLACIHAYIDIVEFLLSVKYNFSVSNRFGYTALNMKDFNGDTILHHSAKYNNLNLLKLIIDNVDDIYVKDNDGNNILHLACKYDCFDIIEYLLSTEYDLDIRNNNNETAFSKVDCKGRNILYRACTYDKFDMFKSLSLKCTDDKYQLLNPLSIENILANTIYLYESTHENLNHIDFIKYMVPNRCDIDYSIRNGNLEIIQQLIDDDIGLMVIIVTVDIHYIIESL